MTTLTPFDERDVVKATIAVTNAGDGLSRALEVQPAEFHHEAATIATARAAVIAAACAETDAEHHAHNTTSRALTAPTRSPLLTQADDARKALTDATTQRRTAVARLRETER